MTPSEQSYTQWWARVTTYGGEPSAGQVPAAGGIRTVQHWQLEVNGQFIADTTSPRQADLFRQIAERCSS